MKRKQKLYNFIIIFFLILSGFFFYKTKYKTIDITDALAAAESELLPNQELVVFTSQNPFNFYDILYSRKTTSKQQVYGVITYPEVKAEKYPLVLAAAGSYGWADHHKEYLDEYLDMGIATFTLHSFKSRGVTSTVGEQVSVTVAMIIQDAYMALNELSKNDKIDIDNVAITGWSLGGGVSLYSAWKPIKDSISPDYSFAAHLPIYPPCMAKPDKLDFTDAPIHILIGRNDDWVPAEACDDLVAEMKLEGYNAKIDVFENAHHSFDRNSEPKLVEHAYGFSDCSFRLSESGVVKTNTIGFPLSNSILQKSVLYFCADRGSTIGGNPKAKEKAFVIAKGFMREHIVSD